MSHTFTVPSAPPVARSVLVLSTAVVTTGELCGLRVRKSVEWREEVSTSLRENILIVNEREHIVRWDADGVTVRWIRHIRSIGIGRLT